jgi:hypothetical protein
VIEKTNRSLRDRNVQLQSEEINRIATRVQALADESKAFETNTKLTLKAAKNYIKQLSEKANAAAKASKVSLDKILEVSNEVSSKQFKKESRMTKREEAANLLHLASNRLEAAERSGKKADGLLKAAQKQGEREASIYLKYFQYAKDGSPNAKSKDVTKNAAPSVPSDKNVVAKVN